MFVICQFSFIAIHDTICSWETTFSFGYRSASQNSLHLDHQRLNGSWIRANLALQRSELQWMLQYIQHHHAQIYYIYFNVSSVRGLKHLKKM